MGKFDKKLDEVLGQIRPKSYEIRNKSTNSVFWVMSTDQPAALATKQAQSIGMAASDFVVNEISQAEFERYKAGGMLDITQSKAQPRPKSQSSSVGATPKIVEFIFGRGVGMWLDGKAPDDEFSIEGEYGSPKWLTPQLSFGGVPIPSVEFDVDPFKMFITSFVMAQRGDDAGTEPGGRIVNRGSREGPKPPTVVKMRVGDVEVGGKSLRTINAGDEQKMVRLLNGEIVSIEDQYYVQFGLS